MNKEVKQLWIDALESGEYEQGVGTLRKKGPDGKSTYCCLGVLCEVAIKAGVPVKTRLVTAGEDMFEDEPKWFETTYDHSSGFLPESVREWAGLETEDGKFAKGYYEDDELDARITYPGAYGGENMAANLVTLNDDARYNFKQIAQVIRERF